MKFFLCLFLYLSCNISLAQSWQNLGLGVDKNWDAGDAHAVAVYNNSLVVGGYYVQAGGLPCSNFSIWYANQWSCSGTGLKVASPNFTIGIVSTFAEYNGELYAGGYFDDANGVPVKNIAKWNGIQWSSPGSGIPHRQASILTDNIVSSLCVYNGELYAAGSFTIAGGVSVNNIAKWNGNTWSSVDGGMNGDVEVTELIVFNNELYAAGMFSVAGTSTVNNIAKWDGVSWSPVGSGLPSRVEMLVVYNNELYAGDLLNGLNKWDGSSWTVISGLGSPNGGGQRRVLAGAVYNNKLVVGGLFYKAGNTFAVNLAEWNGVTWEYTIEGFDNYVRTLMSLNNALYAGGDFHKTVAFNVISAGIAKYSNQVGLNEVTFHDTQLTVSPNPTSGIFKVKDPEENSQLLLTDCLGRIVCSINSKQSEFSVDVTSLEKGVYTCAVMTTSGKVYYSKVIKD